MVRLGHLTGALDQHSDRPASRMGLLDYMAPEMMSARAQRERDLGMAGVLRGPEGRRSSGSDYGGGGGAGGGGGRGGREATREDGGGDRVLQLAGDGWRDEGGKGLEPGSAAAMAAAARHAAAAEVEAEGECTAELGTGVAVRRLALRFILTPRLHCA